MGLRSLLHLVLASLATLAITATFTVSATDTYPSQSINFIVPMAPGGGTDTVSRTVAQILGQRIGHPVVVENKPGAGGLIAASYVARAKPDGYTVFVADTGQLSVNPSLYKELPYDPDTKFVPVTEAVSAPLFLAVNAALPVSSVEELIEYAKSNPGLAFASPGVGSVHHLGMQALASRAGVDFVHVPYRGASQATTALVSGEVPVALSAYPSLRGHLDSGKVRVIAVATPERTVLMPELPTIAETPGLEGFSADVNVGFVLPPATPATVAAYLHEQIVDILSDPDFEHRLLNMGLVPIGNTPSDYAKNIEADTAKYRELIRISGASIE